MAEFIYTLSKARKAHNDKVVLDDVTLAVLPGAKIGVVGPNGAGKSSLLRIMSGKDDVSNGEAMLAPGATVGILEQEPKLSDDKNVLENVEEAVASTKALLTQIVAVDLIGLHLAQVRGELNDEQVHDLYNEMLELPGKIEQILETVEPLRALTRSFAKAETVLFIGRNIGYPVVLEGALKLKELAYIHAEGFAGGELKHGSIALIDEAKGTPVIAILPSGGDHSLDEKMLSNIQEVKARGARVIVIAHEGAEVVGADHIIRIPACSPLFQPILATVPLQVFAYEMAIARGNDVDQPRNLAKSVTVE